MNTRQLKYFVTCAQTGSISEAAKQLYSNQSTVSKAIKNMEHTMGVQLFDRLPRGISLTEQGKVVFQYACKIVSDMDALESFPHSGMTRWIRISLNPSSWFADRFVQFYNENREKNYHCQIYTAGVRMVLERVRDYLDDIGFVYVLEQQRQEFLQELLRDHLEFVSLHKIMMQVYPGRKNGLWSQMCTDGERKTSIRLEELQGQQLIQSYQDEFISDIKENFTDSFSWDHMDVAIVTNSDYIMDKMLKNSDMVNISGSSLSETGQVDNQGMKLDIQNNRIIFGYVCRKGEALEEGAEELIAYLKAQMR